MGTELPRHLIRLLVALLRQQLPPDHPHIRMVEENRRRVADHK